MPNAFSQRNSGGNDKLSEKQSGAQICALFAVLIFD